MWGSKERAMSSLETYLKDELSGDDIREIRTILGCSQNGLAKILDCVGQTVYFWEAKKEADSGISSKNQVKILAIINAFIAEDKEKAIVEEK